MGVHKPRNVVILPDMAFEVPVLLIIFNRPDTTAQVMEALRKVRPRRLFVAGDGPRLSAPADVELCRQTREIACNPDWKCEVIQLFQTENLGCARGESAAMSWFFDQVEEGIILEDECVGSPGFFEFCAYLLEKYRDDERVATIGGNFFLPEFVRMNQPYYFSKYLQGWGWASWRRTWKHYRVDLSFLSDLELEEICRENSATKVEEGYWSFVSRATKKGLIDTWDFQLILICWKQKLVHISPTRNLVKNVGFRSDAMHTVSESRLARLPAEEIDDYRREVKFELLPDMDSLTFYIRFLDSLSSPWWLQQAIPLDEHADWIGAQYENLEQAAPGVKGAIEQSRDSDTLRDFQAFQDQLSDAVAQFRTGREHLISSNSHLAEAIIRLGELKQGLTRAVAGSEPGPDLGTNLLKRVSDLQKWVRGFQILVNRSRSVA
jgi:hypothetical protein